MDRLILGVTRKEPVFALNRVRFLHYPDFAISGHGSDGVLCPLMTISSTFVLRTEPVAMSRDIWCKALPE